ncbi:MAG TPA: SDR family oxidoreductase [Fimbriimonadaceae bacterium]|nr:SDR family oxidoreductase [Fimbriimonadaceae bacterium]
MKVLILGGTGMLGHKLYQTMGEPFDAWVAVRREASSLARYSFYCPDRVIGGVDASHEASIRGAIETVRPDAVVNCIGLIKQHPLAKNPEACISINALLPHRLASMCAEFGARFVHISTDCVFAGPRGGYKESDLTDAEDLYGRTKALGETAAANAVTLRTSIIGRELEGGYGLVEWFLAQGDAETNAYSNAFFSGFTTHELTRVIESVILDHPGLTGIYQVSSDPIDKASLLGLLRESYGTNTPLRPLAEPRIDRTLDSSLFRKATGYRPPAWPEMVREMASDATPYALWRKK